MDRMSELWVLVEALNGTVGTERASSVRLVGAELVCVRSVFTTSLSEI